MNSFFSIGKGKEKKRKKKKTKNTHTHQKGLSLTRTALLRVNCVLVTEFGKTEKAHTKNKLEIYKLDL